MSLFAPFLGIALPSLSGWFLIRSLERNTGVLCQSERIALGMLLGITLSMFVTFLLASLTPLPLSLTGFLGVQIGMLIICAGLWYLFAQRMVTDATIPSVKKEFAALPTWGKVTAALLILWTILKLSSAAFTLIGMPTYYDDVYKNWNMRGKVFFVSQEFTMNTESISGYDVLGELSSYPPTVSLFKTWVATLAGAWTEAPINGVHLVWSVALVLLLFAQIRRMTGSALFGGLGAYLYVSLPLVLVHIGSAYAELFASAHLLATTILLARFVTENDRAKRSALLRLCAIAVALLVFTKNEVLLLYVPLLSAVFLLSFWRDTLSTKEKGSAILWYTVAVLCIAVPWIWFKWSHGLTFGNAKAVSDLGIGWQKGVLLSIGINTFFEANWSLLPVLLVGLLVWQWRAALSGSLGIFTVIFVAAIGMQCGLFLFTGLSSEALNQTGIARGFLQVIPLAVIIVTVLLSHIRQDA